MTNIVVVKQSMKNYLFSVPMGTTLKKYDKVVCDTARGEQEGICFTNSFIVENDALNQIALLTGATLPLKSVVGKSEITRFKDKPQESKFKVGERYKVSDYIFREGGDIIEITDKQGPRYYYKTISGTHTPAISSAFSEVSSFAECLTPYTEEKTVKEVKRHAKVGEYVKITYSTDIRIDKGDICEVIASNRNDSVYVRSKKATSFEGNWSDRPIEQPFYYALDKEYVVLENYTPPEEPEKHTYKIGDYVRIISNEFNDFEVGYVVKLNYKVNPRPDERCWNCTWEGFDDTVFTGYVFECEFEPFEYEGEK